jgi:hypothetical protein
MQRDRGEEERAPRAPLLRSAMKHERLLHPQLARVVGSLGHGQLLGIGDAG